MSPLKSHLEKQGLSGLNRAYSWLVTGKVTVHRHKKLLVCWVASVIETTLRFTPDHDTASQRLPFLSHLYKVAKHFLPQGDLWFLYFEFDYILPWVNTHVLRRKTLLFANWNSIIWVMTISPRIQIH